MRRNQEPEPLDLAAEWRSMQRRLVAHIRSGDPWYYLSDVDQPPADWNQLGHDHGSWKVGLSPPADDEGAADAAAIETTAPRHDLLLAKLYHGAAWFHSNHSRNDAALTAYNLSVDHARAANSLRNVAWGLHGIAELKAREQDTMGRQVAEEARDTFAAAGSRTGWALAIQVLAPLLTLPASAIDTRLENVAAVRLNAAILSRSCPPAGLASKPMMVSLPKLGPNMKMSLP